MKDQRFKFSRHLSCCCYNNNNDDDVNSIQLFILMLNPIDRKDVNENVDMLNKIFIPRFIYMKKIKLRYTDS